MSKRIILFVCSLAIFSIFAFSLKANASSYSPIYHEDFNGLPLGNLASPWATFGGSGRIPRVISTYSLELGGKSLEFGGSASDIDRAKVQGLISSVSSSQGAWFRLPTGSTTGLFMGLASSSTLHQYIFVDGNNSRITISDASGTVIFTSLPRDTWFFASLQWDSTTGKIQGCYGSTCSAWYTPATVLNYTDDYLMIYQGSASTSKIYVDTLQAGVISNNYDYTQLIQANLDANQPHLATFACPIMGEPWDSLCGWLKSLWDNVVAFNDDVWSFLYVPSEPALNKFDQTMSILDSKFPFNFLKQIYELFNNFTVPSVASLSVSVTVLGESHTVTDFSILNEAVTPPGGTPTTVLALIRSFETLGIWFSIISFLIWWIIEVFKK